MEHKITFRDKEYPVNPVSKVYFRALTECLNNLGDVDNLSRSAKAIKKVIIPSIGNDVIQLLDPDTEFYIWEETIEPAEINDLILLIVRCFRLQMIARAKAKGNETEVALHEEGLAMVNKYLDGEVEEVEAEVESDTDKVAFEEWKKAQKAS